MHERESESERERERERDRERERPRERERESERERERQIYRTTRWHAYGIVCALAERINYNALENYLKSSF